VSRGATRPGTDQSKELDPMKVLVATERGQGTMPDDY
jgi:hypothetical protein